MIRLVPVATGTDLALAGGSVELTIQNPYFDPSSIPGSRTQPFDLPWTRDNLRGLNFPHQYRGPGGPPPTATDCYLDGARWRRGQLLYKSVDAEKKRLRYNFVADAADLATQLRDVQLPDLDLGTVPLLRQARTADYALLPVRNPGFYGDPEQAPAAYHGVLNYCTPAGQYPAGAPLAPQPYLAPVLRKVLAHFGYAVAGPWVDDPEIQQLVLYSDRVLAAAATSVELARHVPAIDVPDLLISLQQLFGLGFRFDAQERVLRITPLRDVLAGAGEHRARAGVWRSSEANATNGFLLQQRPDTRDALDKTLDVGWQQLRVGAGGETLEVSAGTLHLVTEQDSQVAGRTWQLPAIDAKGGGPEDALGDETQVGLRLLFDRGQQADSTGALYPLGSPLTTNLAGATVGQYSLRWGGTAGLYATWHQAWLTFRSRAVVHEYEAEFRIADLLALDPGQVELVDAHLQLWEKVTVRIREGQPLSRATITYHEIL